MRVDFVPDTQTMCWMWASPLPSEAVDRVRADLEERLRSRQLSGITTNDSDWWAELVDVVEDTVKWELAIRARERGSGPSGPAQQ